MTYRGRIRAVGTVFACDVVLCMSRSTPNLFCFFSVLSLPTVYLVTLSPPRPASGPRVSVRCVDEPVQWFFFICLLSSPHVVRARSLPPSLYFMP